MLVDGNAVDKRRLERENTLNTDVVTDLANGETLLLTLADDLNHHTTVLLDTLLVTLLDAVCYRDWIRSLLPSLMRYATVIVSPGKNCGCCLFVANACSATLIKSIVISFNVLIITSQYTQATLFLVRDYEKRGKGSTISRTGNKKSDFFVFRHGLLRGFAGLLMSQSIKITLMSSTTSSILTLLSALTSASAIRWIV